jgi:hypothetical protein
VEVGRHSNLSLQNMFRITTFIRSIFIKTVKLCENLLQWKIIDYGAIKTNESVPQYFEGETENMMKGQLLPQVWREEQVLHMISTIHESILVMQLWISHALLLNMLWRNGYGHALGYHKDTSWSSDSTQYIKFTVVPYDCTTSSPSMNLSVIFATNNEIYSLLQPAILVLPARQGVIGCHLQEIGWTQLYVSGSPEIMLCLGMVMRHGLSQVQSLGN